ncbi:MAG: hypothetical protein J6A61_01125 [Clostridia bacterium]|nr:hypothetical protein [Clostridia bacterium]
MEETRKKHYKHKKIPTFYKVGVLAIIVFFGIAMYLYFHPSFSTQVVYHGTEEVVIPAKGILVWNEEVLTSSAKGIAVMNYSDGTRVTARTHVASVYSGEIDEAKSNSIKSLSEKINSLETGIKNSNRDSKGTESSSSVILKKMRKIAYYSQDGDFQSLLKETNDIESMALGQGDSTPEKELEKLKNQRDDLERTITGHKDAFYSATSGLIYSKVDGYETTINKTTVQNADTKLFSNLWNLKPVDYSKTDGNYVFGKIINNYEATMLAEISAKEAEGIEVGDVLYIKSSDVIGGKIACTVTAVSIGRSDAVLTLSVTKNLDTLMGERKLDFDLVKKTYSGLRIPKEAILGDENEPFVYAIKDSVVKKKPVEILCEKNEFVIVKEDNQNSDNVLLYDLVITKSKNLTEGMIVSDPR